MDTTRKTRGRAREAWSRRLDASPEESVRAFLLALEAHDATVTRGHSERTEALVGQAALVMGLGDEGVWTARRAALLHDVGKVGVPVSTLNKPGELSREEWGIVRRHPEIGAAMLSGIEGYEETSRAVLAHHERHDGRGYPFGLSGTAIPLEARLICVADAYDAMTNDRPYRKPLSHEEAVEELEAGAGYQFDPRIVEAVKAVLDASKYA